MRSDHIRLVIADDHSMFREGLKLVLSQHQDVKVIGEAADGDAALLICKNLRPDVFLVDIAMPGPGVLELVSELKVDNPKIRILVLSMHPVQHYARRVLRAGADGYITKNYTSDVLYSAIRQVSQGRKYVTPEFAEDLAAGVAQDNLRQPHENLSNREYQVFLSLGSGMSIQETSTRLGIKPKTVRTYRSRILEKTNLKTTAELIFHAVSHGLVDKAPEVSRDRLRPPDRPAARRRS